MQKLISSNNFSVLALYIMMRNNEKISDYILNANEHNPSAEWCLGEVSETMAETLNVSTCDNDTRLSYMMLSYFNQVTSWEIVEYATEDEFSRCKGSSSSVDFHHEAADTDVLLSLLESNAVVKIRTSYGEYSSVYRAKDWEIVLLKQLKEYGVFAEISLTGDVILVGVLNTDVSDVIETIAAHDDDLSKLDVDSFNFIELLKTNNAKLAKNKGFITFSRTYNKAIK